MNTFSIADLEQYSGIKAHTIRIWEQRYNALKPNRTEGNTRFYDNSQLKRLLNIVSLMDSDYKISEICLMNDKKINELLDERLNLSLDENNIFEYFISQILISGIEYNQDLFDKIFQNCVSKFGLKVTYINVLYPLDRKSVV